MAIGGGYQLSKNIPIRFEVPADSRGKKFKPVGNLFPLIGKWKALGNTERGVNTLEIMGPSGDQPFRFKVTGRELEHVGGLSLVKKGVARVGWGDFGMPGTPSLSPIVVDPERMRLRMKIRGHVQEFKLDKS